MTNPLGRYAGDAADELVTVHLLSAPLHVWQRASEHHDELMREMSLLALAPAKPELSGRLLELVNLLGHRYGAASTRPDDQIERGLALGLDRMDLRYDVPRSAAAAAVRMRELLDAAEAYSGTELLTLAQPPVVADFGRWYVDQFVRQVDGRSATPWPGPWTRATR